MVVIVIYASNNNKHQSNLAKGRIAVASTPNSSFVFATWQHRTDGLAAICNCMFWMGGLTPNLPFRWGFRDPDLTQYVIGPTTVPGEWHLNPSNSLGMVHECDRWQTYHAFAARVIPLNNNNNNPHAAPPGTPSSFCVLFLYLTYLSCCCKKTALTKCRTHLKERYILCVRALKARNVRSCSCHLRASIIISSNTLIVQMMWIVQTTVSSAAAAVTVSSMKCWQYHSACQMTALACCLNRRYPIYSHAQPVADLFN